MTTQYADCGHNKKLTSNCAEKIEFRSVPFTDAKIDQVGRYHYKEGANKSGFQFDRFHLCQVLVEQKPKKHGVKYIPDT